jgi:hypothetical protein
MTAARYLISMTAPSPINSEPRRIDKRGVPVPSDTGATDGDLEDKYITSRYRVLMNKA